MGWLNLPPNVRWQSERGRSSTESLNFFRKVRVRGSGGMESLEWITAVKGDMVVILCLYGILKDKIRGDER